MPLTTVSNGRTYDWSHAVGRAAATGTGFNYPQTMCLGNDGDVFVANRGNENNFGQRVNRVRWRPRGGGIAGRILRMGRSGRTFDLAVRSCGRWRQHRVRFG